VCPRLEALTLLYCGDVDISALTGIVIARNWNGSSGAGDLAISESDNGGAGTKGAVRAIRPMKKLRRQGRGVGAGAGEGRAPSTNIVSNSMMIAMEEAAMCALGTVRG
jgi:hypothetical protein